MTRHSVDGVEALKDMQRFDTKGYKVSETKLAVDGKGEIKTMSENCQKGFDSVVSLSNKQNKFGHPYSVLNYCLEKRAFCWVFFRF